MPRTTPAPTLAASIADHPLRLAQAEDGGAAPPQDPTVGPAPQESPSPSGNGAENGGAQTQAPGGAGGQGQGQGQGQGAPPAGGGGQFLIIMLVALLALIAFSWLSQRRERKKRNDMLASIKKGDRVQTVGGIMGSVAEVRENELLVKVDENTNTRLRFARSAIQSVESQGESDEKQ